MLGAMAQASSRRRQVVFAIVMALAKVGLDSTTIYLMPRLSLDAEVTQPVFMATMTVGVSIITSSFSGRI